jgi:phage terminase small subunit
MDWEVIKVEYETTPITLVDLAKKHDIKLGTVKSRKSREGWVKGVVKKKNKIQKTKVIVEPVFENDDLTDKQKMFCLYYLKYFNITKAYMKAYGVNAYTGRVEGHRLMKKPSIKGEIDRMKEETFHELRLDVMDVLQKYIDIAFADITDFTTFGKKEIQAMGAFGPLEDENGNPIMVEVNYVDLNESTEVDGTIITEIKKGKDGVSVKLADKMKALDKLWEYFDVLPESTRRKLQEEKLKADTEFTKERTKLLKGAAKDTGLLESLIDAFNGDKK